MLSLIIPAYNGENRIENTLIDYRNTFHNLGLDFEIIVEMDGCTDRTPEIVRELSAKFPEIRFIEFKERLGKGGGILKGFEVARGDIVGFVDADGSVPPQEFVKLLEEIKNGYDGAIASRRAKGAIVKNQPLSRKILSKCFNIYVRLLFGLPFKDTQCGAKVFRREVLENILPKLNTKGFAFDVNLLYLIHKHGFKIKEVGVLWTDKYGSKVKISKAIMEMGLAVLKLRLYHSPLRFLFK